MARKPDPERRFAARRRSALRRLDDCQSGLDALLVSRVQDVTWLSGFTGEDSMLLLGRDWTVLLTDGRYDEQARQECAGVEVSVRTGAMSAAIAEVLAGRKVRKLGFQAASLTVAQRDALAGKVGKVKLMGVTEVLSHVRLVKDAEEVASIRRSARVAQKAFKELTARGPKAFVGRTEAQVAAELEYLMRKGGASGASFETIVAAGAHGSRPHYRPGATKIRAGDPVLIDWGALVDGYCSDLTRVVFTGRIPPKIAEIYAIVLDAQQAAIRAVGSGRSVKTVDAAARDRITRAGYGEQFVHGLGHGIGLEIHEGPSLSSRSKMRLRKGMVVTVEPGVYLPGVGGVRIEDDVLVEAHGQTVLTSLPRTLSAMELR
jgi:Xaa-Pro aminopeptidase